jgi:hypothetical protein
MNRGGCGGNTARAKLEGSVRGCSPAAEWADLDRSSVHRAVGRAAPSLRTMPVARLRQVVNALPLQVTDAATADDRPSTTTPAPARRRPANPELHAVSAPHRRLVVAPLPLNGVVLMSSPSTATPSSPSAAIRWSSSAAGNTPPRDHTFLSRTPREAAGPTALTTLLAHRDVHLGGPQADDQIRRQTSRTPTLATTADIASRGIASSGSPPRGASDRRGTTYPALAPAPEGALATRPITRRTRSLATCRRPRCARTLVGKLAQDARGVNSMA